LSSILPVSATVDTALSVVVATVVLTVLGVLIKYFGAVELIAGYETST